MKPYQYWLGSHSYQFPDLKDLMAKASTAKSGDFLAGVAATSEEERIAARFALANLPLSTFLNEALIPYETDELTRLIIDTHDPEAFAPISISTLLKLAVLSIPLCSGP